MIDYAHQERAVPALVMLAACAATGAAVLMGIGAAVVVALAAGAALLSLRWRTGVLVLLVALPLSGLPALLAGAAGLAVRDVTIVVPLYAAFAVAMLRTPGPIMPPLGAAGVALAGFALLALAYTPMAPTPLAGAIGVRVWLAYIPMMAIGYHYVRTAADLDRVLRVTVLIGLVPACVGITEWALAATGGDFGPFEHLYALRGLDDTQRFVIFTTGDGHVKIPRVPSTFTSVSQYYAFTLVAFAAALAIAARRARPGSVACAALMGVAALTSGARAAYVMVPAMLLVTLVLHGGLRRAHVACGALVTLAALAALLAFAPEPLAIAREIPAHAIVTSRTSLREIASSMAVFGHGTGWDTNAALRYGGVAEGRYIENWYAKAALELGIAGLLLLAVAMGGLIVSLIRGTLRLAAPMRRQAAPLVALLALTAASLLKGPYIDLDPMNVYFWLLAGMLFGLYRVEANSRIAAARGDTAVDADLATTMKAAA